MWVSDLSGSNSHSYSLSKYLLFIFIAIGVITPTTVYSFRLPEIDFCPLGGPPGWFNRITGQNDRRYYGPPPPMLKPGFTPVPPVNWYPAAPIQQQPVYFPSRTRFNK